LRKEILKKAAIYKNQIDEKNYKEYEYPSIGD
jgi:hypothetical protein